MKIEYNRFIVIIKEKLINKFIEEDVEIDVCLINSSEVDELNNYDDILNNIKYKFNDKQSKQYEKIANTINSIDINYYDWFIKIRSDLELLEDINMDKIKICDKNRINSRVRWYIGKHINILNGTSFSVTKDSPWTNSYLYDNNINYIVPDDQIYIFHKSIAKKAFNIVNLNNISDNKKKLYMNFNHEQNDPINKWMVLYISIKEKLQFGYTYQNEWFFKDILDYHNIKVNPIGINVKMRNYESGDLII
tara:strand:+ start:3424 stop:4170 length:747 start_codon:yes stop_codon:yes gene_type:complete